MADYDEAGDPRRDLDPNWDEALEVETDARQLRDDLRFEIDHGS